MHIGMIFWKVKANKNIYILVDAKILHRLKPIYGQVNGRKILWEQFKEDRMQMLPVSCTMHVLTISALVYWALSYHFCVLIW